MAALSRLVASVICDNLPLTSSHGSSESMTGLYDQATQLLGDLQGESAPRFVGAIKLETNYQITMPIHFVRGLLSRGFNR